MNDDKFSLKARRTTRIPLRIPVQLVIQEDGQTRTFDGWTMIVNVHGARIESKRPVALSEEILLQVPSNGKAQRGRVVWSGSEANHNGNFEFGLQLASPENLWGVGFPPSDWNANRASAAAELGDPPVATSPRVVSPKSDLSYTGEQYPAEMPPQNQAAEPAGSPLAMPIVPAAPSERLAEQFHPTSENAPQTLDLSAELLSWPTDANIQPCKVEPAGGGVWQTLAFDPELRGNGMNAVSETAASEPIAAPAPVLCETPQPRSVLAAPAPPPPEAAGNRMSQARATDRLSAIFNELVESALEARLLGLAERLGARVEARIAETEAATLARMEQQIHGVIAAQTERLERHAVDLVSRQQGLLEQNVQMLLQDAEANAMRRQQESLETHRQVMRNEMTELVMSRKAQLEQETSELASAVYANLAQSIGQELPSIEKQFAEQCRAQTEQLLATRMEELDRLCADRVQEADQSVNQRIGKIVEENTTLFVAQVEARSELLRTQACGQLEQQIDQITNQTRQAFMRHIVTELKQKQQLWLQQAQQELNDLAEQKLQRTRQSLSQVMKEFGETLIRGTYPEVGVLATVSSEISGREGVRQTERSAENEGYVQPEEVTGVVTCNPDVRLA